MKLTKLDDAEHRREGILQANNLPGAFRYA
jgi:hypothetical protein